MERLICVGDDLWGKNDHLTNGSHETKGQNGSGMETIERPTSHTLLYFGHSIRHTLDCAQNTNKNVCKVDLSSPVSVSYLFRLAVSHPVEYHRWLFLWLLSSILDNAWNQAIIDINWKRKHVLHSKCRRTVISVLFGDSIFDLGTRFEQTMTLKRFILRDFGKETKK